jgi:hypothetical protein
MLVCTISPDRPFVGLELGGANHGLSFRFDHLGGFEYLREFKMDFRLYQEPRCHLLIEKTRVRKPHYTVPFDNHCGEDSYVF